jgi:aspartate racemase
MAQATSLLQQKTIGVLGGMSNYATAVYYDQLNAQMAARRGNGHIAELAIVSVDYGNIEHFVFNDLWDEAEKYLGEKLDRLEGARPDVVLCASNSMHLAFEPVIEKRDTPYIHIVDATGSAMRAAGLTRVGLIGTRFVMGSQTLRARYRDRWGVDVIVPEEADRAAISNVILGELCHGTVSEDGLVRSLTVIGALKARGAEAIVLGCTELCLLLPGDAVSDLPVFDTTRLHVGAAINFVEGDDSLVIRGRG